VIIREALRSAAERLELNHVPNARLTGELLLAHTLGVAREYLYAHDDHELTAAESQSLEDLLYDRVAGVPLQYIVGRQEFYGRDFRVTPDVLIPRPETEYIVEAVLESSPITPRIIDVGTGSGCLAVTLALEIPGAEVFAVDISEAAVRVARENAAALNAKIGFASMDLLDAATGEFDFIVSNPPYIRRNDSATLQREVREHEPHVALFAPEDDLEIYRRLVAGGETLLRPGGYLIMEVGVTMDQRVLGLFGPNWEKLPTKADLQGIPRTVIGRWNAGLPSPPLTSGSILT
jgi:release factor glutamine methyltransferase